MGAFHLFQLNRCVEDCVTTQMGSPDTWEYELRTKWEMRNYLSLDTICGYTAAPSRNATAESNEV